MPFIPKSSFSSASSPLLMECSSERMIELSHRMDQGLKGDSIPAFSTPAPSTPPRRVRSSYQPSLVSSTPSQFTVTPTNPPSTPPKAPSTPVHSSQPLSISPCRFSLSNHRCNESEEEIISVTPVNPDQFLILPSINRISLLYSAITFSPFSRSLLSQLDLLLKLLQCGLFSTYAHDRWLASFEPWRSLPKCI